MTTFISSRMVKKRTPVPCIWCGESIRKGDQALMVVYADDGIDSCYWHPECDAAYQEDAKKNKSWGEPFEPYEYARGSTLCKSDYRILSPTTTSEEP